MGAVFELFEWPFPWIKVSVPIQKDKMIMSAVASDDSYIDEKQENEKEVRIHQGIRLDKLSILGRKKKLLVLPLGGIIVHRAHRAKPYDIPKTRQPNFNYGHFLGSKRMHGHGVQVFGKRDKPLFIKELRHLWRNDYSNLPWHDGDCASSNTLLITAPTKALLYPPNTGIPPWNYDPENEEDNFLGPDGELQVFLNGLAGAMDVPTYVKDNRIGRFLKGKLYEGP